MFGISRGDWERIGEAHARILWAAGVRPGDTVMVAAVFSLYVGSWGALVGAERLGAACFPVRRRRAGPDGARRGVGADGQAGRALCHAVLRAVPGGNGAGDGG